ncbi:hypothetical protein [Kitasatospora cineracea]|uniref:hypothetical protein n=1 Tax=Kitasatospora cineracea TaxID=88074 RepID=UPI00379B6DE1
MEWKASCTDPVPTGSSETATHRWNTGATTTVRFGRVRVSCIVDGSVVRHRAESEGTVIAGSGLGKGAIRTTVFDPVGSACGGAKAEVFDSTSHFRIG